MNTQETQNEEQEVVVEEYTPEEEVVVETATEESEDEDSETTKEPLQIDYKAKHDDLQKKIANDAFKFRKQKKTEDSNGEESQDEDSDDDKPLTRAEVAKMLDEEKGRMAKSFAVKEATTFVSSLTSNADEAAYAVSLWQHITLPFDTMEEQLEFIVGGLNAKRVLAQNAELKRSLASKDTARRNTATTARDAQSAGQPKTDPQVASVLKTQGFTYNSTQKVFSKKLANGKTMYNDGKGKTWVQ